MMTSRENSGVVILGSTITWSLGVTLYKIAHSAVNTFTCRGLYVALVKEVDRGAFPC